MSRQRPKTVFDEFPFIRFVGLEDKLLDVCDDFENETKSPKRRQRPISGIQLSQLAWRSVYEVHGKRCHPDPYALQKPIHREHSWIFLYAIESRIAPVPVSSNAQKNSQTSGPRHRETAQ